MRVIPLHRAIQRVAPGGGTLGISNVSLVEMIYPDRIIAATALYLGVPLVSRDRKILLSQVQTVW